MMKRVQLLLPVLMLLFGANEAHAETDTSKILNLEELPTEDEISFFERTVAALITAVPNTLIKVLGMQDIDTLVFGKNGLVHSTFTNGFWNIASTYFSMAEQLTGALLLIAFTAWGLIFQLRAANPISRANFHEMMEGVLIFVGAMMTASFIIDTIFTVNHYIVRFAMSVLTRYNIPTDMKFLDLVVALQNTPSVGGALIFLLVVVSIGILNYQYAFRMLALVFMMALFPGAAYASIYPWSRKAMDTWLREFVALVFENAGHALAFSIFLAAIHNGASNWVLFAFLFGFPQLASMIRIVVGAPTFGTMTNVGGNLGTMFGGGSMVSMQRLVQNMKGTAIQNQMSRVASVAGQSTLANSSSATPSGGSLAAEGTTLSPGIAMRSGGLGFAGSPNFGGLVKDGLKTGAKVAVYGTAGVAGALVTGALSGNPGTVMAGFEMGVRSVGVGRKVASSLADLSTVDSQQPQSNTETPSSRPTILSREMQARYAGRRFQLSPESRNDLMGKGQISRAQMVQWLGVSGNAGTNFVQGIASEPGLTRPTLAEGSVRSRSTAPLVQDKTGNTSTPGDQSSGSAMTTRQQLISSLTVPASSLRSPSQSVQTSPPAVSGTRTDTPVSPLPTEVKAEDKTKQ